MNKALQFSHLIHQGIDAITLRTFHEHIRFVKSTGLSMAQFGILLQIQHQDTCGISGLSNQMHISGAAASQLVDKLVQAGLLERTEDPADRRNKVLKVSDKGLKAIQTSQVARHKFVDTFIDGLMPGELEKVGEAMEIIYRVFNQMQEDEKVRRNKSMDAAG